VKAWSSDSMNYIYDSCASYSYINKQKDYYKKKCNALEKELIETKSLHNFDQETQSVRSFTLRYKTDYMCLCSVLSRHITDDEHTMIIDAGANKNISPDMCVVYNNCLIGHVLNVYDRYSCIKLVTDKRCKVGAVCVDTQTEGIGEGMNKTDQISLSYVNHLLPLKKDDLVITSGQGLVYPRGFALGRVASFVSDGLSYTVSLTPLVNVSNISYCYVLAKGAEYVELS
jgi:rod shape-determining protein MreC